MVNGSFAGICILISEPVKILAALCLMASCRNAATLLLCLQLGLAQPQTGLTLPDIKRYGICYAPSPLKGLGVLADDDFMSDDAKPLWGSGGRDDLNTIGKLLSPIEWGRSVRLYGNNPQKKHGAFLDYALRKAIAVIPGISNYPYIQMNGSCLQTGFNCYNQIKNSYMMNLQNGFVVGNKYHPALSHLIVMNEPDWQLSDSPNPRLTLEGKQPFEPQKFILGMISAIDGILDAEKEAGVTDNLINITVTFAFRVCHGCSNDPVAWRSPALGQMLALRDGLMNPQVWGYNPQNDLAAFFNTRFLNSFNTQNTAEEVRTKLLLSYPKYFSSTPLFIEEYHAPEIKVALEADLTLMREIVEYSPFIKGMSFFEYQRRYDKTDRKSVV